MTAVFTKDRAVQAAARWVAIFASLRPGASLGGKPRASKPAVQRMRRQTQRHEPVAGARSFRLRESRPPIACQK